MKLYKKQIEATSFGLHIIAMASMLIDHIQSVVGTNIALSCVGRLAFPIFAFLIAEGFRHTHSRKKYLARLTGLAIISEMPYDLFISGAWIDLSRQNVIWTFVAALLTLSLLEKYKGNKFNQTIGAFAGMIIATLGNTEYAAVGILTVVIFHVFQKNRKWQFICILLLYLVLFIFLRYGTLLTACTLLALMPIWTYKGQQGLYNKGIRAIYYGFYPLHLLVLLL